MIVTGAYDWYVEMVDEGRPCLRNPHDNELVDGPWLTEPDEVWWVHQPTDLDCLARRNDMGAWCGYVGVPSDHPAWMRDPFEVDTELEFSRSLNFANTLAVPHPIEGRNGDVYWLGFDCAHIFDVAPTSVAFMTSLLGREPMLHSIFTPTYKTLNYVRGEVTALAEELGRLGA